MEVGKTLLLEVVDRIDLDDEVALFGALGTLGRKWAAMAGDIDGAGSAIELLRAIAAGTADADVAAAFDRVGAADALATLQSAAGRLGALLDSVPETLVRLLDPIGRYDEERTGTRDSGLIRWPLETTVGAASGGPEDAPSYALSLAAGAALTIEAGDSWPYSDPMPGPLLRLRAEGSLKPKASATLPFGIGTATGSAEASAACALEYYFAAPDPGSLYAVALGERIGKLVDPFDFDSLWEGFATSDLAGVHYEFDGSAALGVSVSVADAGPLGAGISADFGASIAVGFGLGGKYYLTFRAGPRGADGAPRIVAALSRERRRSSDFGVGFGATIDLGALAARLHAILARALGAWDGVLADFKPYLSPGTWLRDRAGALIADEAKDLVKDETLRTALVRDLQGAIGVGASDDSALAAWVGDRLAGALDMARGWAKDRAGAVDGIVDDLGRALPAFARTEVRAKLEGAAAKLVDTIADDLETRIAGLATAKLKELGKAIGRLGVATGAQVANADDALAGVRKLIDRYDTLFRKLLAATGDAARTKISIAVQLSEARLAATTMEVEGSFLRRSDGARAIFDALTRGEFAALIGLIDAGAGGLDFALDAEKSSLRRFAGSTGTFGVELVALGFGVSGSELLSAEAEVLVDGTGKVQVDAKGRLERRFSALDAEREIELVSSFSLVRARALADAGAPPAADRAIGLAVTIGHVDTGLKRHEVERFVGSLVDAGLVDAPARETARATFNRWAGNPGSNGKLAATLQLRLALARPELSRLLRLGAPRGALADGDRRAIVRTGFDALADARTDERVMIDEAIAFLARRRPHASLDDLLMAPDRTHRLLLDDTTGTHIRRLPALFEPFDDAMRLANGMLAMVEQQRQIYFSTPETRPDHDPLTWSAEDYRDAERRATKAVREWLQLNSVLFWTDSKVHPRTLAFLSTVAALAGIDPLRGLSLTMWRKDGDAPPETVVISHAAQ